MTTLDFELLQIEMDWVLSNNDVYYARQFIEKYMKPLLDDLEATQEALQSCEIELNCEQRYEESKELSELKYENEKMEQTIRSQWKQIEELNKEIESRKGEYEY